MAKRKVNTIFDGDKPRDNTKLRRLLFAAIIILAAAALILLTVSLVRYFGTEHLFTEDGGGTLVNNRTGVTYKLLALCPYKVDVDKSEVYAVCDDVSYYKVVYKNRSGEKVHCDPEKILATVDEELNITDLYFAEGFTFPSFDEISPSGAVAYYVRKEESEAMKLSKEQSETVYSAFKNGENSFYPSDVSESNRLNIYLFDIEHPQFWYTLEYFETESGELYMRDLSQSKCVKATDILKPIFKGTDESGT